MKLESMALFWATSTSPMIWYHLFILQIDKFTFSDEQQVVGFAELTEEEPIMDKLFDFGNRYARESTWKDFALVKFCLFSMGLAAGTQIPEKHKKKAIKTAACVFAATYIPLMTKVFRLAFRRA